MQIETTPGVREHVKSNDRTEPKHTTTIDPEVTSSAQNKKAVEQEKTDAKKSVAPIDLSRSQLKRKLAPLFDSGRD